LGTCFPNIWAPLAWLPLLKFPTLPNSTKLVTKSLTHGPLENNQDPNHSTPKFYSKNNFAQRIVAGTLDHFCQKQSCGGKDHNSVLLETEETGLECICMTKAMSKREIYVLSLIWFDKNS
jgi:hypothetical protein